MKRIKITLFDGNEKDALKDGAGNLIIESAFNGTVQVGYDAKNEMYYFPADALKHHEILSVSKCAETLGLSRVRVWRMAKNGTLKSARIGEGIFILRESVEDYLKERKLK